MGINRVTAGAFMGALFVLGLVGAQPADACTCVQSPTNCAGATAADAVFEATVEGIELAPQSSSAPPNVARDAASATFISSNLRVVALRDINPLKGEPQAGLVTEAFSESCGYEFRAGVRYLIVAHRLPDGRLAVSKCGLTRPLSDAAGFLEYIKTLDGSPARTRAWGQVTRPARWVDFSVGVDPVAAARVTVTGPAQRSVMTGADGRYSFSDLPHGVYSVSVDLPDTLPQLGAITPDGIALDATTPHACSELDFIAPVRSEISGAVTEDGKPVAGLFVQLQLAEQLDLSRGAAGLGTDTDANGIYRFPDVPPGRYMIGVSIRGPAPFTPFAEAYARSSNGAMVIPLALGERVTLPPIATRRLTPLDVSGTVQSRAGDPVRGVEVTVAGLGEGGRVYPMIPVKTDDAGRFRIRLWQGERFRVIVGQRFNPDADVEFIARDTSLIITTR